MTADNGVRQEWKREEKGDKQPDLFCKVSTVLLAIILISPFILLIYVGTIRFAHHTDII